jgi:hypothetical protein
MVGKDLPHFLRATNTQSWQLGRAIAWDMLRFPALVEEK